MNHVHTFVLCLIAAGINEQMPDWRDASRKAERLVWLEALRDVTDAARILDGDPCLDRHRRSWAGIREQAGART